MHPDHPPAKTVIRSFLVRIIADVIGPVDPWIPTVFVGPAVGCGDNDCISRPNILYFCLPALFLADTSPPKHDAVRCVLLFLLDRDASTFVDLLLLPFQPPLYGRNWERQGFRGQGGAGSTACRHSSG